MSYPGSTAPATAEPDMSGITVTAPQVGASSQPFASANVGVTPPDTSPGAMRIAPTSQQTMSQAFAYGLPGIGVGLIDTLGQSVGMFDDKTVENTLNKMFPGGGSFGDFYSRAKVPLRFGGDIVGLTLPGAVAGKFLGSIRYAREAGTLGSWLKNSASADWILGSSSTLAKGEAAISQAALSNTTEMGVFAGRTFATPAVVLARRSYTASRLLESVRQSAAFEATFYGMYNKSDTFYPADYSGWDQAKWAAGGIAVFGAVDQAVARLAVRKLLQGAAKTMAQSSSSAVFDASPLFKDLPSITVRPNDRGAGLTGAASIYNDIETTSKTSDQATLLSNIAQDKTLLTNIMSTQIKAMGTDLHPVIPKTSLDEDQVKLGLDALKKNPTTFAYATKLGNLPENAKSFYDDVGHAQDVADKILSSAEIKAFVAEVPEEAERIMREARDAHNNASTASEEIHYVINNDGSYTPYKLRADNWLDQHDFGNISRTRFNDVDPSGAVVDGKPAMLKRSYLAVNAVDTPFRLNDDFSISRPGVDEEGGAPTNLSPMGTSAYYAAASKMIKEWRPVTGQKFILNESIPWRQTEATLALAAKYPQAAAQVQYAGAFKDANDALFHVLDQKYQEFKSLMPSVERPMMSSVGRMLQQKMKLSPSMVTQSLNLPGPVGMEAHPLVQVFGDAMRENQPSLAKMFVPDVPTLRPQVDTPIDLLQAAMRDHLSDDFSRDKKLNLSGNLLAQTDTKPLFVAAKSTPMLQRNDTIIHAMITNRRELQLSRLAEVDPKSAPLVSTIAKQVAGAGWADQARQVETLFDGVLNSSGIITGADRVAEQFPALKAAQLGAQITDKFTDDFVKTIAKPDLEARVGAALKPNNRALLFDFNRIEQSYRHGWDIAKVVDNGDGTSSFLLKRDDDKILADINQRLGKRYFQDADVDEADADFMPDMSIAARRRGYIPLRVSKEAAALAQSISDLSRKSGIEYNSLRVALGNYAIKIRDFHLPTPDLFREGTWFVRNSAGDVVDTYTGNSPATNKTLAIGAAQKATDLLKDPHFAVPMEDVQRAHSVLDRNFMDVTNYADQLAKSGAGIGGGLAHAEIDRGDTTLKAMIRSLHQQFLNVGVRTRAAMFEPELNYALQAAQSAGPQGHFDNANIFDIYRSLMFGRSIVSPNNKAMQMYSKAADILDSSLSWLHGHFTELNSIAPESKKNGRSLINMVGQQTSTQEFNQINKGLKDWSPFKDVQDFVESTYNEKPPPSARKFLGKLSLVSSTMAIRMLDVGTAVNNLAGVMAAAPGMIAGLRRRVGEDREDWIARTAAWGTNWTGDHMTFSPTKALANVAVRYWNGDLAGPMKRAADAGMFQPEYAALAQVLTNPVKGGKGALQKWTDYASYLADHSEILSRKLSWGLGYSIAKEVHQFDDERNSFIFANNFVNEMIGNYNPNNKPGMFQGAIGLPLGAFQTWMFNTYRRLYGFLERGDARALIYSYGAQASLFGAKSTPGWAAFNNTLFSNYSGTDNINSRFDRYLPSGVSDLLLNGSLSSIPRIFGADAPAFYVRGSEDMSDLPATIFTASKAPPIEFLLRAASGIKNSLNNIFGPGRFSLQEQEEILAGMSTNRAFRSIMEQAANAKVDQRGQVIEIGTRDAAHWAASLMGAIPSSTQHLQEAYQKEQASQMTQADLRAALDMKTRALMRGGEFGISDFQNLVQDYVKAGGNPAYVGTWLRNTEATAVTPKIDTKMKSLADSGKWLEFLNMLSTIQQQPAK